MLGDSLTPDTVVQFLSELFRRATFPSPQSREYMAGDAPKTASDLGHFDWLIDGLIESLVGLVFDWSVCRLVR